MLLWQLGAALLAGLVFLAWGRCEAVAAAAGAVIVALGTALMSARTFSRLGDGGVVLMHLLTGMILKWIVVLGGLIMILVQCKLPPLAAITGLVAAYAVNLAALRFKG
jgi:membrane-associated PAP2 superfamily phosphatase